MRGGGRLDLYRPGKNQKYTVRQNRHNFSWLTRMKTFSIRKLIYRKFYTCDKPALLVSAKLVLPNSACKMGFRAFLSLDVEIVIICFAGFVIGMAYMCM
jgi:hypothetical protein